MSEKEMLSFTPVQEIPFIFKATKLYRLLKEFGDSEVPMARVTSSESQSKGLANRIRVSAKRFGMPVDVITRAGAVYLIRREADAT